MDLANNINSVIETLCEKFGLAWGEASKLVPEIILYGRLRQITYTVLAVLAVLAGAWLLWKIYRICLRRRGDDTYRGVFYYIDDRGTDLTGLCVLSGFLLAGGVIALLMLVPGTIIWFASPNVAALRYILDLI